MKFHVFVAVDVVILVILINQSKARNPNCDGINDHDIQELCRVLDNNLHSIQIFLLGFATSCFGFIMTSLLKCERNWREREYSPDRNESLQQILRNVSPRTLAVTVADVHEEQSRFALSCNNTVRAREFIPHTIYSPPARGSPEGGLALRYHVCCPLMKFNSENRSKTIYHHASVAAS